MIAEHLTPVKNPRIAARVVEGKALLVIIDDKKLHRLNEVGTRIWELCDGRSVGAIADTLIEEFDVDRPSALVDVERFVLELQRVGALVPEVA